MKIHEQWQTYTHVITDLMLNWLTIYYCIQRGINETLRCNLVQKILEITTRAGMSVCGRYAHIVICILSLVFIV